MKHIKKHKTGHQQKYNNIFKRNQHK